jgi:hypothetical protein
MAVTRSSLDLYLNRELPWRRYSLARLYPVERRRRVEREHKGESGNVGEEDGEVDQKSDG